MKIIKTAKYKKLSESVSFKHKCEDCGEFTHLTKRDIDRASIPRCRFCGSTWLEPVTEYAKNRMQQGYDAHCRNMELHQNKTNFNNKRMDEEFSNINI